jgi:hypothetical protein
MDLRNPIFIPFSFVLIWLAITASLGLFSGWYSLARKYPDQDETPLLQLKWQSGFMGPGANMRGLLRLGVWEHGLRIGIMRIFGPFCRDFFLPWDEIEVARKQLFFMRAAELRFGSPPSGRLTIGGEVADRLARAARGHWPEQGPLPENSDSEAWLKDVKYWLAATAFAAAFFVITPRLLGFPSAALPPISLAIGFPAVVFGIVGIVRYFIRTRQ